MRPAALSSRRFRRCRTCAAARRPTTTQNTLTTAAMGGRTRASTGRVRCYHAGSVHLPHAARGHRGRSVLQRVGRHPVLIRVRRSARYVMYVVPWKGARLTSQLARRRAAASRTLPSGPHLAATPLRLLSRRACCFYDRSCRVRPLGPVVSPRIDFLLGTELVFAGMQPAPEN